MTNFHITKRVLFHYRSKEGGGGRKSEEKLKNSLIAPPLQLERGEYVTLNSFTVKNDYP